MEKENKKITMDDLAEMIGKGFAGNDAKFVDINTKFQILTEQMNKNFSEVKKQIDNLSRNTVDAIHQEEFDKLEDRVVVVEEALNLKLKRA